LVPKLNIFIINFIAFVTHYGKLKMNTVKTIKPHHKQASPFQKHATEQKDSVRHQLKGGGLGGTCTGGGMSIEMECAEVESFGI
jgi:hypothetical protein